MTPQSSWDSRVDRNVLRTLFAGTRHECIGGQHYVTPSANASARRIVKNLYATVRAFAHARGLGQVYLDPADLVLGPDDVLQPDLVFVQAEHAPKAGQPLPAGTPDLVVEVLTTQERELGLAKARLCETHQIPEYWLVDPVQEQIEVFRCSRDGSLQSTALRRQLNDTLVCSQLQGLRVPLAEIFE
jgi:Uma2 family endonuclease